MRVNVQNSGDRPRRREGLAVRQKKANAAEHPLQRWRRRAKFDDPRDLQGGQLGCEQQ
jgi:hypothetical protein